MRTQFFSTAGECCTTLIAKYAPLEDHRVASFTGVERLTAVLTETFIGG